MSPGTLTGLTQAPRSQPHVPEYGHLHKVTTERHVGRRARVGDAHRRGRGLSRRGRLAAHDAQRVRHQLRQCALHPPAVYQRALCAHESAAAADTPVKGIPISRVKEPTVEVAA